MDVPPPIPPRPPGFETRPQQHHQQQQHYQQQVNQLYSTPSSSEQPGPPLSYQHAPPRYPHEYQHVPPGFPPAPVQPPPPPSQWNEHLFYSNGRETPVFDALMKEFFSRLQPDQGYITPEAFSSFLDACHCQTEHNVWKRSLKGNMMFQAEDLADYEMKAALEGFYFDHKVVTRNSAARQVPYGGMPMLSLAGFTDFMAVETAADPDLQLGGLNNALRHYGIWPEKGPIPRHVLPPTCPPELQRRIDEATVRCRNSAATKLDAYKAQALLEQRAQQSAVDLLRDDRYYYY